MAIQRKRSRLLPFTVLVLSIPSCEGVFGHPVETALRVEGFVAQDLPCVAQPQSRPACAHDALTASFMYQPRRNRRTTWKRGDAVDVNDGHMKTGRRYARRSSALLLSDDEIQSQLVARANQLRQRKEARPLRTTAIEATAEDPSLDNENDHLLATAATDVTFLMADSCAGASCFISSF